MKDPLSVLITNRARTMMENGINGGEWLKLPATTDQLHEAMTKAGITADNPQDFWINGINTPIDGVVRLSLESVHVAGIDELNYLRIIKQTRNPNP